MKGEIIPNNCTAHIWALAMIVMLRGFLQHFVPFFCLFCCIMYYFLKSKPKQYWFSGA